MRHYSAGDPARALESWYRILEVEPQHAAALQYVSFVRQAFRLDVPKTDAPSGTPADGLRVPKTDTAPTPRAPAPAPAAAVAAPSVPAPAPAPAPSAAAPPAAIPINLDDDEVMPPPAPGLQKPRTPTPAPIRAPTPAPAPSPPVHASSWGDLAEPAAPTLPPVMATPGAQFKEGAVGSVRRFGEDYDVHNAPTPMAGIAAARLQPASTTPPLEERLSMRQSVRFEEPRAPSNPTLTSTATPTQAQPPPSPPAAAAAAPVAPAVAPLTEGQVGKQSVRFDEPPAMPAPAPTNALPPSSPPSMTTAPSTTSPSPWDSHDGPAVAVDVDVADNARANAFESLLKRASGSSLPPVEIARPLPSAESTLPRAPTPPSPSTTPAPAPPASTFAPPPTTNTSASMAPPTAPSKPATPPPAPPAAPPDECEALMTGARELFELGDFSGSLELVEKVLKKQPTHEGARAYLKRNEQTLLKMYESKLGDMQRVPRQLVPPDEVIWMNMHHRAGFILSQVDGSLSYDDLLSVSGMDRFDTVRILADLVGNGIIG